MTNKLATQIPHTYGLYRSRRENQQLPEHNSISYPTRTYILTSCKRVIVLSLSICTSVILSSNQPPLCQSINIFHRWSTVHFEMSSELNQCLVLNPNFGEIIKQTGLFERIVIFIIDYNYILASPEVSVAWNIYSSVPFN